jgi:hypothetical protein
MSQGTYNRGLVVGKKRIGSVVVLVNIQDDGYERKFLETEKSFERTVEWDKLLRFLGKIKE